MASLDSLPADQKAVLSLVLQRGRTFDQIAAMLVIDRAAVRQRALEGLEALGPETSIPALKRALISDYLLGQLPPSVAETVRGSLAGNPPERAWARVIAAEIAPLAVNGLAEIPAAGATTQRPRAAPTPGPTGVPGSDDVDPFDDLDPDEPASSRGPAGAAGPRSGGGAAVDPDMATAETAFGAGGSRGADSAPPPSSRRGGAILLSLIAVVIVVVVVVLIATSGSTKKKRATHTTAQTPTTSTSTSSPTSTKATPLHQINLVSPTSVKGRQGAADVVRANGVLGLVLVAEGLAANAHNAYAVWLYNSSSGGSRFLGFYNNQVTATGKTKGILEAEVKLPADATRYNELLLTLESNEKHVKPGPIVLEGTFAE